MRYSVTIARIALDREGSRAAPSRNRDVSTETDAGPERRQTLPGGAQDEEKGSLRYPVGVERGFMRREDAITRTLATLRFFHASVQEPTTNATGREGFHYHFLDVVSGKRVWTCELSTIDSALIRTLIERVGRVRGFRARPRLRPKSTPRRSASRRAGCDQSKR